MSDTWDRVHTWELVFPPSRPTTRELSRIGAALSSTPRSTPVAVLGSTPEFRDLLAELRFERIFVFERNRSFYKRMSKYRVHRNSEQFVHGQWIDNLGEHEGLFGCILSDLTAGNVPYDQRTKFYEVIRAALLEGGLFIDKNLTNEAPLLSLDEITAKYAAEPINLRTINNFSCDAIFCSDIQLEHRIVDTTRIYKKLEMHFENVRLLRLVKDARLVTPEGGVWYYGRSWHELEGGYCRGLRLVDRLDSHPHLPYFGRAFQFFWRK